MDDVLRGMATGRIVECLGAAGERGSSLPRGG